MPETTSDLAESTEALKRNFLFRGFLRDRGFFDLDSVTRDAYQAGALEHGRTAIRFWIDARVLFVADPSSGAERLSDDGRGRLDSVTADLVRIPGTAPSSWRATLSVRLEVCRTSDRRTGHRSSADYLLSRFRRQTTRADVMPLGEGAVGSPTDGRRAAVWSSLGALRP